MSFSAAIVPAVPATFTTEEKVGLSLSSSDPVDLEEVCSIGKMVASCSPSRLRSGAPLGFQEDGSRGLTSIIDAGPTPTMARTITKAHSMGHGPFTCLD